MRFNDLRRTASSIDPKTLSRVLRYLVKEKIGQRDILSTQPFTRHLFADREKGEQIRPVMQSLKAWREAWILPGISAK